jgi:hypothetical protein
MLTGHSWSLGFLRYLRDYHSYRVAGVVHMLRACNLVREDGARILEGEGEPILPTAPLIKSNNAPTWSVFWPGGDKDERKQALLP